MAKVGTIKRAVHDHCRSCIYDASNGGSFHEQSEGCTITECHLYSYRPLTSKTVKANRQIAFDALPQAKKDIALQRSINFVQNVLKIDSKHTDEINKTNEVNQ